MNMRVDQSGNDRASAEIYDPCAASSQNAHVTVTADRDKAPIPDGDRLLDREVTVNCNNFPVAQYQIGRSRHGQGTLKVHFMAAATGCEG